MVYRCLWMSLSFFPYIDTITCCHPPTHFSCSREFFPSSSSSSQTWFANLQSPHPSLPSTIPLLLFIFQKCNLRSPAVQGAPECVYAELHFITRSRTAANFTRSIFQPSCLWQCFSFFLFWCRSHPTPLLHAALSPAAALLEKVGWTVNGLWSANTGAHHCHWAGLQDACSKNIKLNKDHHSHFYYCVVFVM